ncbi:MAG: AraC family transcriptional regulator [Pseudomonadota bacterium]
MNSGSTSITQVNGINVAAERFVSVNGPPLTGNMPKWGVTVETAEIEYHLCPAITYELHYQLPRYVLVHMFNGAEGRFGVGDGPMASVVTESHRSGLVPPNMRVRIIQDTPLEYITIRVDPERFSRIAGATAPDWSGLEEIFRTIDTGLTALFNEIRRCLITEPVGMGDYLDALTDSVIARMVTAHLAPISNEAPGPEMLSPAMARRVAQMIEERLAGSIKVSDLAKEVGLSRAHFSRAFAQNFGTPPRNYILSRRNARARTMLTDTQLSASQIALLCGFANPSHLTTAFKQELGLTPSEYRRALETGSKDQSGAD